MSGWGYAALVAIIIAAWQGHNTGYASGYAAAIEAAPEIAAQKNSEAENELAKIKAGAIKPKSDEDALCEDIMDAVYNYRMNNPDDDGGRYDDPGYYR